MVQNKIGQLEVLTDKEYKKLPFDNVYEENGKAYWVFYDNNGEEIKVPLGKAIVCEAVVTDIDTSHTKIILHNGRNSYELMPSKLDPENVMELADYGFGVTFKNKRGYYCYISDLVFVSKKKYSHSFLGWKTYKDKLLYATNDVISKDIALNSKYSGDFVIEEKGTLDNWINGISELVIGNLGMELSLLTSVCAILNGYIGDDIGLQTFLVHLWGNSSTGKTTAEKVAMSFTSKPVVDNNSLFNSFSGTYNSLINLLTNNYGLLLIFDDTSNVTVKDMKTFVYAVSSNVDKRRLNASSTQMRTGTWHTVVLTSGEQPLIAHDDYRDGYKVRYIEINLPFTNSAEHAHNIENLINENYGVALEPFVKKLLKFSKESVIEVYKKYHTKFMNRLEEGKYNDRLSKIYSLYMLSASLLNKTFNFKFDKKRIFDYFCSYHNEFKNTDNGFEAAYEYIKREIDSNLGHFIVDSEHSKKDKIYYPNDCWGSIYRWNDYNEVCIFREKCDELLKNGGFGNLKEIYRYFRDREWIDCDKDLFTRRKVIHAAKHTCIVFIFSDEDIPMFITYKNSSIKKKRENILNLDDIYDEDSISS